MNDEFADEDCDSCGLPLEDDGYHCAECGVCDDTDNHDDDHDA